MAEEVEYVEQDVLIEVSSLREPFVRDLTGVIMGAAMTATDDLGRPRLSPEDSLRLVVERVMELVDCLVDEIVTECLRQTAEQMGGSLVEDDLFFEGE